MAGTVTHQLIDSHLVAGDAVAGRDVGVRIDQALLQDATGTLVMLELEAMGLDRVRIPLAVQYIDHNLLQQDQRNPDDHRFLASAARHFGIWFSRAGNGISHPVHGEFFAKPGQTLLGSDSHTPANGCMGMLAIGAGGLEVALAMAGEPFWVRMPQVWGVKLTGKLPRWVSAKDVILEMLRRHGVTGGRGRVIEYHGPGLAELSVMDRHVIANMGAELGATATVFPSDEHVQRFLRRFGREADWVELQAEPNATYDLEEEIDLGQLEPLVALPSSPGHVVPVRDVAGRPIAQAYIGSSANPGYRDFAVAAHIVRGHVVDPNVSLDINPSTRRVLADLVRHGEMAMLLEAGARLHQAGCNGCIGMGQAPATDTISVRTVPRNFPGRSGTREDQVYLVSPETAAASALAGRITDPRELDTQMEWPNIEEPDDTVGLDHSWFVEPLPPAEARAVTIVRGPNIKALPRFEALPATLRGPVLIKVGDDISTDEILPAGSRVLPFRSNVPEIAQFVFEPLDPDYPRRAQQVRKHGADGHVVVAGHNYGQGSSREHAAIAPRYLGLRAVIAKSFARIHWQNLANFGVLPLTFVDESDYGRLAQGDELRLPALERLAVAAPRRLRVHNVTGGYEFDVEHDLGERQLDFLRSGSLINWMKRRLSPMRPSPTTRAQPRSAAASTSDA